MEFNKNWPLYLIISVGSIIIWKLLEWGWSHFTKATPLSKQEIEEYIEKDDFKEVFFDTFGFMLSHKNQKAYAEKNSKTIVYSSISLYEYYTNGLPSSYKIECLGYRKDGIWRSLPKANYFRPSTVFITPNTTKLVSLENVAPELEPSPNHQEQEPAPLSEQGIRKFLMRPDVIKMVMDEFGILYVNEEQKLSAQQNSSTVKYMAMSLRKYHTEGGLPPGCVFNCIASISKNEEGEWGWRRIPRSSLKNPNFQPSL